MFNSTIFSFKLWLTALLVAAFVVAPVFAEPELPVQDTEICEVERVADHGVSTSGGDGEPFHEGHGQHSHACGTCHVHMLRQFSADGAQRNVDGKPLRLHLAALHSHAAPSGLFRPPRA